MNPSQKDDDGQEWEPWNAEHLTDEQRAKIQTVPWWAIRDGYSRLALVWAEVDKDAILADHRDAQQLREFMEWLTDQQVVHWTLTEETANDPRKAVEALLQTYLNEINDPTISEVARKAAESDVLRERVRVLEEAAFLQRFQLRTAWFNLGCRCGFDDQHHKLFEDAHCPWHGTQVMKDSWEAVAGFSDDGTPLLPSSVATEGDHV